MKTALRDDAPARSHMPPRSPGGPFFLVRDKASPAPAIPVPLREVVLDELLEALVIFDLLRSELTGEAAAPLLWIAPHLERIFGEIGERVEQMGE